MATTVTIYRLCVDGDMENENRKSEKQSSNLDVVTIANYDFNDSLMTDTYLNDNTVRHSCISIRGSPLLGCLVR